VGTPSGLLSLARFLPSLARLLLRLARETVALGWARRGAVQGFRRGLEEAGLPPDAVDALAAAYPALDLKGLVWGGGEGGGYGTSVGE
jgi:hypothetical protein